MLLVSIVSAVPPLRSVPDGWNIGTLERLERLKQLKRGVFAA
jgi:hypothetical protein